MKADNGKAADNRSYHKIIVSSLPGLPLAAINTQCNWWEVVFEEQQQKSPERKGNPPGLETQLV